ncbi:MAG: hypothetical protein WCT03_10040 [Candidatus Obscuribacterales bacterium]
MYLKKLVLLALVLALLLVCYEPVQARLYSERASGNNLEFLFAGQKVLVTVSGKLNISQSDLRAYVSDAALAVGKIYGQIPVKRTVIRIEATDGHQVGFATSTYDDEADYGLIEISMGRDTSRETLNQSWTLTHEMLHLGFPIVERSKRWLAEGIATYEEPIGRLRMGMVSAEEVWEDLVRHAPAGLPKPGDGGLNNSGSWGRTYWGGAIYCLLADIEIRQKTANKYGLEHALRGIASGGGTARSNWSARQALAAGDKSIGLDVLTKRYREMAHEPKSVDLASLWKQLGIKKVGTGIVFDDSAPLANIRKAIEAGS